MKLVHTTPTCNDSQKELDRLNAQPWMADQLKLNPSYVSWGNSGDGTADVEVLANLCNQNDLNEVFSGYYFVYRETEACFHCDSSGYNEDTRKLSETWYANGRGDPNRWMDKLTQDEVDALTLEGRLGKFLPKGFRGHYDKERKEWLRREPDGSFTPCDPPEMPTADAVNQGTRSNTLVHDCINQHICLRTRAERQGVWGLCPHCEGSGHLFTEPTGHLGLQLWFIHPRRGESRQAWVKDIQQTDLLKIRDYFRAAMERTQERFAKIAGLGQ